MCSISEYNAAHMTGVKMFVYGFKITSKVKIPVKKIFSEFKKKRSLRHVEVDFLQNGGYPFIDGDRKMILTGCESTAKILKQLLPTPPKIVAYPIWSFTFSKKLISKKWAFFFLKKNKNKYI